MLTKDDVKLLGDSTRKIVREEIEVILNKKLEPIHKDIKVIKRDVKKLQKDVDGVINMADHGLLNVQRRVRFIERDLKIPSPEFV